VANISNYQVNGRMHILLLRRSPLFGLAGQLNPGCNEQFDDTLRTGTKEETTAYSY
jgi:hypothetical protein